MKIAVTGASGFIGGHLVRSLAKDNHQMIAFSRRFLPQSNNVESVTWDLHKRIPTTNKKIDIFIHAAAVADINIGYDEAYRINVLGTKKAYELALATHAKKFIYISSASVYSSLLNKRCVDEAFEKVDDKDNNYALTKYKAEQYLINQNKIATTILRPHIVYGPGDTRILYELLKKVHGTIVWLPVHTTHELSTTHIGNIVDATRFFIKNNNKKGISIYNIADRHDTDTITFMTTLLGCVDTSLKIKKVGKLSGYTVAVGAELVAYVLKRPPILTRNLVRQLNHDSSINIDELLSTGFTPTHSITEGSEDIRNWLYKYGGTDYYRAHVNKVWPGVESTYIY